MAAAIEDDQFEVWLNGKLKEMNTDQDVFASYIRGILEGDDADDEKLEALEGILVEIVTDGNTVGIGQEFLDKWNAFVLVRNNNDAAAKPDVDAQLATIMEKQAQAVVIERKSADVDKEYRDAILLQYSHVSDGEEDDDEETENKAEPGTSLVTSAHSLAKNTNVEEIQKAEKDKREKAKADIEKKKAQDKANREKQKQQQQERKEKEKKRTQKGERKR